MPSAGIFSSPLGKEDMNGCASHHRVEGRSGGWLPAAEYSQQAGPLNFLNRLESRTIALAIEPEFSAPGEDGDNASEVQDTQLPSCDPSDAVSQQAKSDESTLGLSGHADSMIRPQKFRVKPKPKPSERFGRDDREVSTRAKSILKDDVGGADGSRITRPSKVHTLSFGRVQ